MLICQHCNSNFKSQNRNSKQKFCSRECFEQSIRKNYLARRIQEFWTYVDKSGDCWLWTGGLSHGYGRISFDCKDVRAHRFSWIIHFGDIQPGLYVCHKCDNPRCVRPDHLFLGTASDNMRDCANKGRLNSQQGPWFPGPRSPEQVARWLRGEKSPRSKVTETDVRQIRALYAKGRSFSDIAARFGISSTTVGHIVHRRTWRHVS